VFADIEQLVGAAAEVERVLGELGEHHMNLFERNRKRGRRRTM